MYNCYICSTKPLSSKGQLITLEVSTERKATVKGKRNVVRYNYMIALQHQPLPWDQPYLHIETTLQHTHIHPQTHKHYKFYPDGRRNHSTVETPATWLKIDLPCNRTQAHTHKKTPWQQQKTHSFSLHNHTIPAW